MIHSSNLPFSYSDFFSEVENLENLRDSIRSLIQHDIATLETLLQSVEETLSTDTESSHEPRVSQIKQKQQDFILFRSLSQQNRDRSTSLSGLAQLVMHMIDFIEESQHRYSFMASSYQTEIEHLRDTIQDLRTNKSLIENDVELFKEQLERARNEIDTLAEQQRQEQIEQRYQTSYQAEEMLQKELQELRSKLAFYKQNQKSKAYLSTNHTLRNVYSEHQLHYCEGQQPSKNNSVFRNDMSHYSVLNKVLQAENSQLRKRIQLLQQLIQTNNMKQTSSSENYQVKKDLSENYQSSADKITQEQAVNQKKNQFSSILRQNQSKISFASLIRDDSINRLYVDCHNQEETNRHRLSSECQAYSQEYDLVPEFLYQKQAQNNLIYLSDDESSINNDASRQRFDSFNQKSLQILVETKQSDKSIKEHQKTHQKQRIVVHNPVITTKKSINMHQSMNYSVNKNSSLFTAKKGRQSVSKLQKTDKSDQKSLYSSFFNFFVNKRIRRTSTKANSGCSAFLL